MRIKEDYETQVNKLEQEKLGLIKKLNEALLELDGLQQQRGELNDRLISVFKFNRDVERQTLRSDDLSTVVDESLREELRQEKHRGVQMKEQLRAGEEERLRCREAAGQAERALAEWQEEHAELRQVEASRERDLEALGREHAEVLRKVEAYAKEVAELRELCGTLEEMISGHRMDLDHSQGGRLSLKDQFAQLERRYLQTVERTKGQMLEITHRHKQRRRLLGANFLVETVIDHTQDRYFVAFDHIKRYARTLAANKAGLIRLRRLFKQNKRQRQRRALHFWYFSLLKPLKNMRQKEGMSLTLQARNPTALCFNRWRTAFLDAYRWHHLRQARLSRVMALKSHQANVIARRFLLRWRANLDQQFSQKRKLQKLARWAIRRDEERIRRRLYQWKALVLDLENAL